MRKFLAATLFLFTVATTAVTAQIDFGIKAGANLPEAPTLNVDDFKSSIRGNTGWFVGPTAKFVIPVVGLGVEANLLYSQANIDIDGQNILTQSIEVPLMLRYELSIPAINRIVEPFIAIGPQFGWNIGDKSFTLKNIADIAGREYRIKDSNTSLNLGLGLVLFNHLQIHGNYNLALGKTADITGTIVDFTKELAEIKTNTWQVSLAYIF